MLSMLEDSRPQETVPDCALGQAYADSAARKLRGWLTAKENEHLEFKEARNNFHFEKLVKYCAALANEGGGSIVLGVGDKRPRRVVGTQAFAEIERTKAGLLEKLRFRVDIEEILIAGSRVLVVTAPPRPLGAPIGVDGAYWMRAGEDLVPMTPDVLRRIYSMRRAPTSRRRFVRALRWTTWIIKACVNFALDGPSPRKTSTCCSSPRNSFCMMQNWSPSPE